MFVKSRFSIVLFALAMIVILALSTATFVLAQDGGEGQDTSTSDETNPAAAGIDASTTAVITPVMGYQGRLVEAGLPVNGDRSMTFRLYNDSTAGTLIWTEGPKTINVNNGLFYTSLGDTTPFDLTVMNLMDQNMWLEIVVGATTLPRQRLRGSPYAFSLAPGADIEGSLGAGQSVLKAQNTGAGYGLLAQSASGYGAYGLSSTGHGVYASSNGTGLTGSALQAEAGGASGIAIWGLSNSADTTLVSSNNGAGPLFKGFGNDGGEHEFIILNDGTVEQEITANGLVKAAVFVSCNSSSSTIYRSFNNIGATITISNGATAGTCTIQFGVDISARYFVVSAPSTIARIASCFPTTNTSLECGRFDATGNGIGGQIMVLLY